MAISTKNRAELKSFFRKNSIPTEEQFGFLIDGMINPKDDGVVKSADTPLGVGAAGDATREQPVLHLYKDINNDDAPAWTIGLNARTDNNAQTDGRPGLHIHNGQNKSRLFIDENGNIGLGTSTPEKKLHLQGGQLVIDDHSSGNLYPHYNGKWMLLGDMPYNANGANGWNIQNAYGLLVEHGSDFSFFGIKSEGGSTKDTIIAWGDDPTDSLRFVSGQSGADTPSELMRITGEGLVGIGNSPPRSKLDVQGIIVGGYGKLVRTGGSVSADEKYYYVGSLPNRKHVNNGQIYQKLKIVVFGGDYHNRTLGEATYYISTRDGLKINKEIHGGSTGKHELRVYESGTDYVFVIAVTGSFPLFSIRSWKLESGAFGQQEILIGSFDPTGKKDVTETTKESITTIFATTNDGKVGMGTQSPKKPLHIVANSRNPIVVEKGWSHHNDAKDTLKDLPDNSFIIGGGSNEWFNIYWRSNNQHYRVSLKGQVL